MRVLIFSTIYLSVSFSSGLIAQDLNPDSLFSLGHDFYSQAKYEKAAVTFDNASSVYLQDGDSLKWINSKIYEADAWMNSGQVQKGLELLLATNKHIPINATTILKASLEETLGRIYRELEQYEKSIQHYLDSIKFANASNDSVLIATLNNNISYPYLYSGDYERAFSHQKKAKEIYESTGEDYRLSFVLNGMFLTLRDLGLHTHADQYIRQSLALREDIGNPNLMDVAYHNMALSFNALSKPDSAIIYYRKSLELSRELGNPYDITQTLNNIGGLYERSGDYDNALAYYNEALQTNYQTERPVSIANNLARLARVAIQNNDLDNATAFYEEALDWLGQVTAPRDLVTLYLDMANLEIIKENITDAKRYLNEADVISGKYNFNSLQPRIYNIRGKLYYKQGTLNKSLVEYRKAYKLSAGETVTGKIDPTINLAKAYHRVQSDSAFILADQAFTLIDSIRTNVAGMAFRSGFFRKHAGFYNEVAGWYITQKDQPEKAFELIEAAKARVLMDELVEAREKMFENLDQSTLIRKQQLAKQVDRLYSKIEQAKSEQEREELRRELKDREFAYQSFLNEIQAKTGINDKISHPKPVSLQQARSYLDPQTAFVEYAFADSSLIRLVITQNSLSAEVIDSVHAQPAQTYLTHQIKDFRQSVLSGQQLNEVRRLGQQLSQTLLPANFEEKYEDISSLVIIPAGPLSFLPFEALSHQDKYLIENYQLKYLPSVSIYPFIENPHRITEKELLAVAGSGFEEGESWDNERSQSSFASLPSTLLEVDSIAVNFTQKEILKNDEVTEASLKSHDLGSFRFLHFATHANVDERNPSRSGLLLSRKDEVESLFGEDGHLNNREIAGLNLKADLVTLSACNTGMGKQVTGEGVLGLQRSFLSAGASSVMVSLWSVFDRSTAVFMSKFYQSMLAHKEQDYGYWNRGLDWIGMYEHPLIDYKTKAVRDAKLALIDHPYYNHPVHWAPFILIGK